MLGARHHVTLEALDEGHPELGSNPAIEPDEFLRARLRIPVVKRLTEVIASTDRPGPRVGKLQPLAAGLKGLVRYMVLNPWMLFFCEKILTRK